MRIGDILIADGVIDAGDLDGALSEQLVTRAAEHAAGGASSSRLGSVLLRRGAVPADVLARALARQHGVPAALGRHLDQRDPALASLIPAELARRFVALPVAQSRGADGALSLIVCMRDPADPAALELLGRAARMPIVAAVACEAVLLPLVTRIYSSQPNVPVPIPDSDVDAVEGVDIDFDTGPIVAPAPAPDDDVDPLVSGSFTLVELDDRGVARDETQIAPTTNRPSARISAASVPVPTAAIAAAASVLPPPELPAASAPARVGLDITLTRIENATQRDAIADAAIAYLAGRWSSAIVFVVRDGLALGHRGFGGALNPAAVEAIAVPLAQPSVLRTAHDRKARFSGPATDGGAVQDRLLRAAGIAPGAAVEVVPMLVADRVIALLLAHGPLPGHFAGTAADELAAVARAMEAAYLRLIRENKRAGTTPP